MATEGVRRRGRFARLQGRGGKPRDPFDNVYTTIANDLLAARKLTSEQRVQIHQVSSLRFAADLAPYAFQTYLARDGRKGTYTIKRLPAADDPVVAAHGPRA